MKKILAGVAMLLCVMVLNVTAGNTTPVKKTSKDGTTCECCKNCKDQKCKDLCARWGKMTTEQQNGAAGKTLKAECMKICEEKKCCTAADGKATSCKMESGSCCKKPEAKK
jgi:hypothetical protein